MHISEGVLSAPVLAAGAVMTASGTYIGLKNLKERDIPTVGILSSAFFVASLVHVPLGPTSVHLILNGLNGIILRWTAFPSLLVALFLQAVLFQFGGITTLGVNTFNMAFPAVIVGFLFRRLVSSSKGFWFVLGGALSGALAVGLSGICVAVSLSFTGQEFLTVAKLVLVAHVPVMAIEAIITPVVLSFIRKVNSSLLGVVKR